MPETFTFRFGIPMLGAVGASESVLSETDEANLTYYLRGKKQIAVTAADPRLDLKAVVKCLPMIPGLEYVCIPSFEQVPLAAECLRKADDILLIVEAGENGGRRIMHLLEDLKVQDVCNMRKLFLHLFVQMFLLSSIYYFRYQQLKKLSV